MYLLPLSNSLDQYVAYRLTSTGLFQVVTDPAKADAVFTDSIGVGLEQKMSELYDPKPPKTDDKDKDKDKDPMGKPAQRVAGMSRGRGTLFLVDRANKSVVWSIYWPVKSSRPVDTDRRATDIVKQLAKDIHGK